ncbi:uncharacterized protein LOC115066840 [Nannospalax galili]|uniref:uncharacterized protein LOC115066840 n=1 Tax=Nannospalax galili TaxID=1026970 RepID=UPI00111BF67B|nr:uncharacterized protein LOC115066840 [Nannospalax galili]
MSIDAQVLKRKISRTCDEAARTLLRSLLFYILDREDGPQKAEDGKHRASCPSQSQEVGRRPTRFQLLQAKFMGSGREPHLKRTREVGRLISKDKQGPGRSLVSATINKLLEKTKEGTSQRPPTSEKPQWSPPSGKSTVKNILKKFLAAEEKEAKEKEAWEKPPAPRPGAARGLLPKIVGRTSIFSKLKERFEQSSCLRSEVGVLPLHREGRKSKTLQKKKVQRPQIRVLHMATLATSCTRTPPAHLLACTAEPLPALSIATIVCGPQSWLSHCTKISHLESRRQPIREPSLSSNSEDMEPAGNKTPGVLSKEQREQLKSLVPQAVTHVDSHVALNTECILQPSSSGMSCEGRVLSVQVPALSPLGLAQPRGAGPAENDRTLGPNAQEATDHTQGVKEDTREAPEIIMTVCSSEDEAERTSSDLEREPFFAIQRHLPEQEAVAQIPLLAPLAVQAEQRAQPAIKSPQITVQLPIVHEMPALPPAPTPLQSAASCEDKCSCILKGENMTENTQAVFSTVTEDRKSHQAPMIMNKSCGMPMSLGPTAEHRLQEDLRDATSVDGDGPQMFLIPMPSKNVTGGKEKKHSVENAHDLRYCSGVSRQSVTDLNWEKHPLPESNEAPTANYGTSSYSTAVESHSEIGTCSAAGPQQEVPTTGLMPSQVYIRPESSITTGKSIQFVQEECKRPLNKSSPPLRDPQENISYDSGNNSQSSLDKQPRTSIKASGEATIIGNVTSLTVPQPSGAQNPEHKLTLWPAGAQDTENRITPSENKTMPQPNGTQHTDHRIMPQAAGAPDAEHKKRPQAGGAQDAKHKIMSWPTGAQNNEHTVTSQLHGAQGAEPKITHLGSAQDSNHKLALWAGGAQAAEHKTTPQSDSSQDNKHKKTLWPVCTQNDECEIMPWAVDAQSTKHKTTPQPGSAQDTEYKVTPWAGGAQHPGHSTPPQSGGSLNTKYKIMSQAGDAQDIEHKITPRVGDAEDAEQITPWLYGNQNTENKTTPWSGSVLDSKDKITQEPSSHSFLAPSRFSQHKSGAVEGSITAGMVQSQRPESAAPTVQPGETADSFLVPAESHLCVSSEPAVSKPGQRAANINRPMEGGPLCSSTAFPSPQKNPGGCLAQAPLPPVGQHALEGKCPEREQHLLPGATHSTMQPTGSAMRAETRHVERAQDQKLLSPTQQAEHRVVPQAKSLGSKAKESLPTQVDVGKPQSHLGSEEIGMGHLRLYQAGGPDASASAQKAVLCVTEPQVWASQDLVVNSKMPVEKTPHQHRVRGQEHPLRPLGRQEGSPTQGHSPQAGKNPATPGSPGKPGGLAVQGQTQGHGQASHSVPQAWGQPDSLAKGAPTAGTSGEPLSQGPRVNSQGSPSTQHLPQESQSLAGSSTTTCSLETADGSPQLTSHAGGHPPSQPFAQDGFPNSPEAKKDLSDGRHRRSVHFAKYHAQSFSDQRAFDLSFRPTVLRASDTFEPPK